jgi:F-box protein 11
VITPGYMTSDYCRKELQRFLERERRLGRNDLILPIMYVETPALTREEQRERDPLAQEFANRQWINWKDLRFEPWKNPAVGRRLEQMAVMIRDAIGDRAEQIVSLTESREGDTDTGS